MQGSGYWSAALKHWKLITSCALLLGMGAYVGSRSLTPLYQSVALIQVAISSGNTINDLLASDQLVQTEALLATSDPVLREVASHYIGMTVDQLSQEVTSAPKPNTQLFEIDVLNVQPQEAAMLANDVATTLIKQQLQIAPRPSVQGSFLLLVQTAQPSERPVEPNVMLNVGGGVATGLLLGVLAAVLLEQWDTRVRTAEDVSLLFDLPVLATVWQATTRDIVNPVGKHVNIECYRTLRTNIGLSVIDAPLRSLLITSALPGEGKSVIAANLAIFMAKAGRNTLLIDADLRHPIQRQYFNLPDNCIGLSNAVMSMSMLCSANSFSQQQFVSPLGQFQARAFSLTNFSLEPFMHSVGIANLRVIPAGALPPNPSELLDSKAMQRLLPLIESCGAEVVIFDTPALLDVSDTSFLASHVDATLLVVDITRARRTYLEQAKRTIVQTGTRFLGCVVNKQPQKRRDLTYASHVDEQPSKKNQSQKSVQASATVPHVLVPLPPGSPTGRNIQAN